MKLGVLLCFVVASVVSSVPIVVEETTYTDFIQFVDETGCDSLLEGLRYNVAATDCSTGYVECVSFGKGIFKECEDGTIYDTAENKCIETDSLLGQTDTTNCPRGMNVWGADFNQTMTIPFVKLSNETLNSTNETVVTGNQTSQQSTRPLTIVEVITDPVFRRAHTNMSLIEVFNVTSTNTSFFNETFTNSSMQATENETNVNQTSLVGVTESTPVTKRNLFPVVAVEAPNCINACEHGTCDSFSVQAGCICLVNFTGATCNELVEKERTYKQILDNSFTIGHYLEHHYFENGTLKDDHVTTAMNGATVQTPNSLFAANTTGNYFQLFWTEVVDHVWAELLPEHFFLRNMTCDQFSMESLGTSFQRIHFYSQYATDNFQERLVLMEAVLVKLKFMLNDKSEVIKQDTVTFLTQWKNYLAVVSTRVDTTQEQVSVTKFSQSQMKDEISVQMNETYELAGHAYQTYLARQSEVEGEIHSNETLEELESLVSKVKESSVKAWGMVVDYGFWFLTYHLAVTNEPVQVNMNTMLSEDLDFYSWVNQRQHHDMA